MKSLIKGGFNFRLFYFKKLDSFANRRDNPFIMKINMKKSILIYVLTLMFALSAYGQNTPKAPSTHLKVGDAAPELVLNDTDGNAVKLSGFKGKKSVVLAFYVLAFTGG
jgi:cytochrome oxidase Cu insertion factor (SCO1/SenC/PrrC family)